MIYQARENSNKIFFPDTGYSILVAGYSILAKKRTEEHKVRRTEMPQYNYGTTMGSGLLSCILSFLTVPDQITHRCIMKTKEISHLFLRIAVSDAGIIDNVVSFLLPLLYIVRKDVP